MTTENRNSGESENFFLAPLEASDLQAIDNWIKSRPEPKPSRAEAVKFLIAFGIQNDKNFRTLSTDILLLDSNISNQFTRILDIIDRLSARKSSNVFGFPTRKG